MEFRLIDRQNWKREEYFVHYYETIPCTYSMTTKLDITPLITRKVKLYPALLYSVSTIVNRHEEFRTAIDDKGRIGIISEMTPCYTFFHKDTETFSTLWTEYSSDYAKFCKMHEKDILQHSQNKGLIAKPNPPANTFPVSMIPWTTFDGFNLNLKKGYDYLLPIFTFGKYYKSGESYYIPLSIQTHHSVCDGYHTCRFINQLQEILTFFPVI